MARSLAVPAPIGPAPTLARAAGGIACSALAALLAAVLPGWSGIASVAWLLTALAVRRVPAAGVIALIVSIPLEQRYFIPTLVGDLTLPTYLGLATVAGLGLRLAAEPRLVFDRVAIAHALVIVTLVASVGAGGVRLLTWWQEIASWLLPLAIYIACRSWHPSRDARMWIVRGLGLSVVMFSMIGFWQYLTGSGPASFTVGDAVRIFGPFDHPNTFAAWLVLSLPMLAAVAAFERGAWSARGGIAFGGVALVLTQSRGGLLAFAVALAVMTVVAPRHVQRLAVLWVVVAVTLALVTGMLTAVPGVERFASVIGGSGDPVQVTTESWGQLEREAHWGAAWSMMQGDPVFGVGAAEFSDNYREHTSEWRYRISRGSAHNGYLHLGAEAGVPGAIAFTIWVGTMLAVLARRSLRTSGNDFVFAAGALGAATAYAMESLVEYLDVPSLPILLAVLVAVGLSGQETATAHARVTGAAL